MEEHIGILVFLMLFFGGIGAFVWHVNDGFCFLFQLCVAVVSKISVAAAVAVVALVACSLVIVIVIVVQLEQAKVEKKPTKEIKSKRKLEK